MDFIYSKIWYLSKVMWNSQQFYLYRCGTVLLPQHRTCNYLCSNFNLYSSCFLLQFVFSDLKIISNILFTDYFSWVWSVARPKILIQLFLFFIYKSYIWLFKKICFFSYFNSVISLRIFCIWNSKIWSKSDSHLYSLSYFLLVILFLLNFASVMASWSHYYDILLCKWVGYSRVYMLTLYEYKHLNKIQCYCRDFWVSILHSLSSPLIVVFVWITWNLEEGTSTMPKCRVMVDHKAFFPFLSVLYTEGKS
jgi:hypothetical protein